MGEYFKLHSNCFIVSGESTDIIYDLHYGSFLKIKKRISDLIQNDFTKNTIEAVKAKYPDWTKGIDAYINLLIEKELAFITSEPHKFPPISQIYESPFQVVNAIIELDKNRPYDNIFGELLKLGCLDYQLIVVSPSLAYLDELIAYFSKSRAELVEFLIIGSELKLSELWSLKSDFRFAFNMYGSTEAQKENLEQLENRENLKERFCFIERQLDVQQSEKYGLEYFNIDLRFFIESKKHNVGLNKKVSITKNGDIKNYLNHAKVFGNINNDNVTDVILSPDFQSLWNTSNDKIEKCKKCIYRYMCFSNSDIIERNGKYYKKDDCNYDPFTELWEDELTTK